MVRPCSNLIPWVSLQVDRSRGLGPPLFRIVHLERLLADEKRWGCFGRLNKKGLIEAEARKRWN